MLGLLKTYLGKYIPGSSMASPPQIHPAHVDAINLQILEVNILLIQIPLA